MGAYGLIYIVASLAGVVWFLIVTVPSPKADIIRITERIAAPGERVLSVRRQGSGMVWGGPLRVYLVEVENAERAREIRRVGVGPVMSLRSTAWRLHKGGRTELLLRSMAASSDASHP
jgi:hypothetical protein